MVSLCASVNVTRAGHHIGTRVVEPLNTGEINHRLRLASVIAIIRSLPWPAGMRSEASAWQAEMRRSNLGNSNTGALRGSRRL